MILLPRLDENSNMPLYVQIYEYMKQEIVGQTISENTRLPSIRKMADLLAISTTPVELAYHQLIDEGYIISKPKSGYYVKNLPNTLYDNQVNLFDTANVKGYTPKQVYKYDFHLSKNDFNAFPFQTWRRLFNQVMRLENKDLLFYGDPQGEEGLRNEIAKYLYQYRGVQCSSDQVVIAADQYALLNFISQILREYSVNVAVENPGYILFRSTFKQQGFQISPIELEKGGISLQHLYDSKSRIVCVSPSHQYPRGMIMPVSKRLKLLEWAKQHDGYIIEDDYDGEFRYHGRPIPSLQGLLHDTNVIYLGGFSQVLAPAMCINYMVLPKKLVSTFHLVQQRLLFEQSSSPIHQKTLEVFMKEGYLARHIAKMRNIYRKKHDKAINSIQTHFGEKASVLGEDAGFHLLIKVHSTKKESELIDLAKHASINIASATFTWFQSPIEEQKEFILGFASMDIDDIEPGIKLLSEVWLK
ncbi:PLP-dependent aminotransferase family protein [Cytobacillus sp. Hm23]